MSPDVLVALELIFKNLHGSFYNKSPSPQIKVSFKASAVGVVKAD